MGKVPDSIVVYDPRALSGGRFPIDIPIEQFVYSDGGRGSIVAVDLSAPGSGRAAARGVLRAARLAAPLAIADEAASLGSSRAKGLGEASPDKARGAGASA